MREQGNRRLPVPLSLIRRKMSSISDKTTDIKNRRRDWLPAIPGVLICFVTLSVFLLDIIFQEPMSRGQDVVYPLLMRMAAVCSLLLSLFYLLSNKKRIADILNSAGRAMYWFTAFALLIILSTIVNGFTKNALAGVPKLYIGVPDLLIFIFAYLLMSMGIRKDEFRHYILILYLIIADCIAPAALYYNYGGWIYTFAGKTDMSAIFFHTNHYGYFLTMAVLISAGYCIYGTSKMKVFGGVSLLINLAALIVNHSTGCILAVFSVLILLGIRIVIGMKGSRAKVLIISLLTAVICLVLIAGWTEFGYLITEIKRILAGKSYGYEGHGRWQLWTQTVKYIKDRPLIGYGCEGIREMLVQATGTANPHNEVLTYAAYFGIPVAIVYCTGAVKCIAKGLKPDDSGNTAPQIASLAAAGYFVSALFGVGVFYTVPFFFVFLGISAAVSEDGGCENRHDLPRE